jgi:hypothetical protein
VAEVLGRQAGGGSERREWAQYRQQVRSDGGNRVSMITARDVGRILAALTALFALRVGGQYLVSIGMGGPLPPMGFWYSGLIPYPLLLPLQLSLLALMTRINSAFRRGSGWLVAPRPRLGRVLVVVGAIYLLSMVARLALTFMLAPDGRWLGSIIPVVFHWVLAGYVLSLGMYHRAA